MPVSALRLSFGAPALVAALTFSLFGVVAEAAEPSALPETASPAEIRAASPALAQLEAALARLESQPIRAKVKVKVGHRGLALLSGNVGYRPASTIDVEDGPRGVRIGRQLIGPAVGWNWSAWPWQMASSGADEGEPILEPQEAAALLDYRPVMEEWLGRATLIEEGADSHQGKKAWKLVFRLTPPEGEEWKREVPAEAQLVYDDLVTVWIDEEGTPLAVSRKARFGLGSLLAGESEEERELQVAHGRLVTLTGSQSSSTAGLKVFRGGDIKRWKVTVR